MNKKSTIYLLIALIAMMAMTDSSYATPIIRKYNIEETLAYWTPERVKDAKPLVSKSTGFRNKKRSEAKTIRNATGSKSMQSMPPLARQYDIINNTISAINVDAPSSYPVGRLFMSDPSNGSRLSCTASVINTANGNIGVTAAHCLFNSRGQMFNNLMFSPGYNNGIDGPLGQIPVAVAQVTDEFRGNNDLSDYGLMRFAFNDPAGLNLQQYTGSLGWKFNVGTDIPTVIFGYPTGGDFEDCPNDGQTLCKWEGETELESDYYVITDENLGTGASGGPWIMNYDPSTNLGFLYGNTQSYDSNNEETISPIYSEEDFNVLVGYVSDN